MAELGSKALSASKHTEESHSEAPLPLTLEELYEGCVKVVSVLSICSIIQMTQLLGTRQRKGRKDQSDCQAWLEERIQTLPEDPTFSGKGRYCDPRAASQDFQARWRQLGSE